MRRIAFILSIMMLVGLLSPSCKKSKVDPPQPRDDGYKIYKLGDIEDQVELPSFINIMFQVTDMDGNGVANLTQEDFRVLEDNQPVSPSESAMQIRKQEVIPYKMKTVLMLDNSYSVGSNLSEIKSAAKSLVNNKMPRQEIAIFSFSDQANLVIDFSDDINDLNDAINSIELGYPSTNLYGAIIEGVNQWEDKFETEDIAQGFMVLFTDGSDTQGSNTIAQAKEARGDKKVYAIGLGDEIEPSILREIGNSGSYTIDNISELTPKFQEIQNEMERYANSFYWLNYMTPKRGDFDHALRLSIIDNPNKGKGSFIEGSFNSRDFYSVMPGLYINASAIDDDGVEEVEVAENDTVLLVASSYLGYEPPQYIWESDDPEVIEVKYDNFNNNVALAIAKADSGAMATVTVRDLANDLMNTVVVKITKSTIPSDGLIANYTFPNGSTDDQWADFDGLNYGTQAVTDRFNNQNAILFDGVNDKVDISSSLLSAGAKAISFWIKPDASSKEQVIMTNTYDSEFNDQGITISLSSQNILSIELGNGSGEGYFMNAFTSMQLADGQWYHVVFNFDGEALKGYINNSIACSTDAYNGEEAEAMFDMRLGASYQPLDQYYQGALDDLRFYNRALTENEIEDLFTEGGYEE